MGLFSKWKDRATELERQLAAVKAEAQGIRAESAKRLGELVREATAWADVIRKQAEEIDRLKQRDCACQGHCARCPSEKQS